jgi:SIR2-like domain
VSEKIIERLVQSIQQRRLVTLTGAGLSMADPSSIPSAAVLTSQVVAEYERRALPALPAEVKGDLERLTEYLFDENMKDMFLYDLVQWRPFRRSPNLGHRAIADLLTSDALQFCVTTNYDELVEITATDLGEDCFEAAYDLNSAVQPRPHKPYLKLHGCVRDREHTVWCKSQLHSAPPVSPQNQQIRDRISSLKTWMLANVPQKDLLVVGFWSDWGYLNEVLEDCVSTVRAPLVVLVNPESGEALNAKAPNLWRWAHQGTEFVHIQERAEVFLGKLRDAFSRNVLTQVLLQALPSFKEIRGDVAIPGADFDGIDGEDLHALRRDVFGVPPFRIPRFFQPDGSMNAAGRAHLLLRHSGATIQGTAYKNAAGQNIRVINGKTRLLSAVKAEFNEGPPTVDGLEEDFVVCAGATGSDDVQSDVIRERRPDIVRSGTRAKWLTLETAMEIGLC